LSQYSFAKKLQSQNVSRGKLRKHFHTKKKNTFIQKRLALNIDEIETLLKFRMQQNSARFGLLRQSDEKQCALKKMSEIKGARSGMVGLCDVRETCDVCDGFGGKKD